MDRKQLLFITFFTLATLGINYGVDWYTNYQQTLQHTTRMQKKQDRLQQNGTWIQQHQRPQATIPTTLLATDENSQPLVRALEHKGFFITLLQPEAPQQLFTPQKTPLLRRWYHKKSGLALYHTNQQPSLQALPLSQPEPNTPLQFQSVWPTISDAALAVWHPDGPQFKTVEPDHASIVFQPQTMDLVGVWVQERFWPIAQLLPSAKRQEPLDAFATPQQQIIVDPTTGALHEINLPFAPPVHPTRFDRQLAQSSPANALFPLVPARYHTKEVTPATSSALPLLRRDTFEQGILHPVHRHNRFGVVVADDPTFTTGYFDRIEASDTRATWLWKKGNTSIKKTLQPSYDRNGDILPYMFDFSLTIENPDNRTFWLHFGGLEAELISGQPAPFVKAHIADTVKNISLPGTTETLSDPFRWLCLSNGYFGFIIDQLPGSTPSPKAVLRTIDGSKLPSRLTHIPVHGTQLPPEKLPSYQLEIPLHGTKIEKNYRIFAGPFAKRILQDIDNRLTQDGQTPRYTECHANHGWFGILSAPFSLALGHLLHLLYWITQSWGLSIILLTLLLRLLLYPLTRISTESQQKLQKLSPQLQLLQKKYSNDAKRLQIETMRLYQENGVSPVSGCMPLLIQMPILFGMFDLLKSSIELRGASFIPGWIDDLSGPDIIATWPFHIWFIGSQLHLLPILLGLTMLIQQWLSQTTPVRSMTEMQRQQLVMGRMMAILFTWMFYALPSGLNLYWLVSNLAAITAQLWSKKSQ